MTQSSNRRHFLAASGSAALSGTVLAERCCAGIPVWPQEEADVKQSVPTEEDLAKLTDDKIPFIDRLLTVIEKEIVPKTEKGVRGGSKLFGGAVQKNPIIQPS